MPLILFAAPALWPEYRDTLPLALVEAGIADATLVTLNPDGSKNTTTNTSTTTSPTTQDASRSSRWTRDGIASPIYCTGLRSRRARTVLPDRRR